MCWQWLASKRSLLQATWASTSNKPYKPGCDSKLQRFRNQRLVFKGGKVARINIGGASFLLRNSLWVVGSSQRDLNFMRIPSNRSSGTLPQSPKEMLEEWWLYGEFMWMKLLFWMYSPPSKMRVTTKSITLGLINLDHLYESSLSISIITGGFPSQTIVLWCPLSLELGHWKSKAAQEPKEFGSQINVRNNGSS